MHALGSADHVEVALNGRDAACGRAQSDVAHRFCITSFQWNYYFVSFEGDFTSDPAYDLVTFGWCVRA